jgi:uncharacterized protein YdhG (YjbR/CyaY superfamily)
VVKQKERTGLVGQNRAMSAEEIDDYLAALDEPKRGTLSQLRKTILEILPNADECISYGMPAFRMNGKVVAGFAAFANHVAYFPHSGSTLGTLKDELAGFSQTKSSLHFAIDSPLPKDLVAKLIAARIAETLSNY